MNTNVQISKAVRRRSPYFALAAGVVLRALRDKQETGMLQRDDIHDTSVTVDDVLWWARHIGRETTVRAAFEQVEHIHGQGTTTINP